MSGKRWRRQAPVSEIRYAAPVSNGGGDKMKLGVLGGTFDPVHNGHILIAEAALSRLNLAQVLFIPAGHPRFKGSQSVTAAGKRLRMVELAIAGKPSFRLSAMEMERKGVTYTVDTLRELKGILKPRDELFFIMGWDSLKELPLWHNPSKLISLCRLVVVPRAGYPEPDLTELEKEVTGISQRVVMLDGPQIEISSSDIREKVKNGADIRGLVPDVVAEYIAENGLYK
jgi:nicotinate-nucleotide adenylyltransferase